MLFKTAYKCVIKTNFLNNTSTDLILDHVVHTWVETGPASLTLIPSDPDSNPGLIKVEGCVEIYNCRKDYLQELKLYKVNGGYSYN